MTTNTPPKIFLKDYTPPVFAVERIALDIRLYDDHATVSADMTLTRQTAGELVLFGRQLSLLSIVLNDKVLSADEYLLDDESLTILNAPDTAHLCTQVKIIPQTNTALEGLYQAGTGSDTMFVTQCEPEGFRKITFFPDRPDVLTTYTTRLESDKKYPILLANGNLLEKGELENDRHYAIWHDPTKKPSYLFACVLADLSVLQDCFTTSEGRDVLLEIYAAPHDIDKCHVAMQALKDAMSWDEEHYGRAYDLDRYMIVATGQFNMGAMENKGLNIFNTSCVLSSPQTTTDERSFYVKAVIAHEYFHNWTGNRITCRDWFQLCLKEGFTVYRDQSFSASHRSPAVQRIEDVAVLLAHQFPEDAGALAHPVRPDSFVEINNFYTTTVYEKGAEIVRMLANLLGKEKFRQGTDEYFRRYDGQAVTVEDFLLALSVADERVLSFLSWYKQPATPVLSGDFVWADDTVTLTLTQQTRQVAGYPPPVALPILVDVAVFHGKTGALLVQQMLLLDKAQDEFVFENLALGGVRPVVSVLRNFSAPVKLNFTYQNDELLKLVHFETDGFNRWQALQMLVNRLLLNPELSTKEYSDTLKAITPSLMSQDPMLSARLFDIPSQQELSMAFESDYRPKDVQNKRQALKRAVAQALADVLSAWYEALPAGAYQDTPDARGQRLLKNVLLDLALTAELQEASDWAINQYQNATCMSERLGALSVMVEYDLPHAKACLGDFYDRFADEPLVIDLWFSVQARATNCSIIELGKLMNRPDFDWQTPNRVRSVLSALANKPVQLWSEEGLGLYLSAVQKLDELNPVLSARLLSALARWHTLNDDDRPHVLSKLTNLQSTVHSKNVLECLENLLNSNHK